jgi:GxxExxY protein
MQVHNKLGIDQPETLYHKLLLQELREAGLAVTPHPPLAIKSKAGIVVSTRYPDMRVVHNGLALLLELKVDPRGLGRHRKQARAYLRLAPHDRAVLLINFGRAALGQELITSRALKQRKTS